jgi:hypothetical protein
MNELSRPPHGGYPGAVRVRPRIRPVVPGLEHRDGVMHCTVCGLKTTQRPNPTGGDSWYYRCPCGHEAWIGK